MSNRSVKIIDNHAEKNSKIVTRLGDIVKGMLENQVSPAKNRFDLVSKLWNMLLPVGLKKHCRIVDVSGGQLKAVVDSTSYMFELQLCSSDLLKELQARCPQARIKKIKIEIE